MSSLTQLRTKHLRSAGSLNERLLSEQRALWDERAQFHKSDQESTVTADILEYAAGEDDVFNNSARDQENMQLQIVIDFQLLTKYSKAHGILEAADRSGCVQPTPPIVHP